MSERQNSETVFEQRFALFVDAMFIRTTAIAEHLAEQNERLGDMQQRLMKLDVQVATIERRGRAKVGG